MSKGSKEKIPTKKTEKNPEAQYNLELLYRAGLGVPQSYEEAAKWFRMSADQGNAKAQNNLGFLYDIGKGVPRSEDEAIRWYTKAAEQGYAPAIMNLIKHAQ